VILIHASHLDETANTLRTNPAFLKIGIDFNAATQMLEDTNRALSVFIDAERALWGVLFLVIPGAAWFASGAVGNISDKMIGGLSDSIGRAAATKGARIATEKIVAPTMKAAKAALPSVAKTATTVAAAGATLVTGGRAAPVAAGAALATRAAGAIAQNTVVQLGINNFSKIFKKKE